MSDIADYSEFRDAPGANILAMIAAEAVNQKRAEAEVARLEEELKKAQAELRNIKEHVIPRLMDDASQVRVTTKDGITVEVEEKLRGSIPESSAEAALSYLEEHGAGAIIKRQFIIEFGKGDEAWAKKFAADLAKRKRPLLAKTKRAVHPQTLLAYLREQLEAGEAVPLEVFGVYRQRSSKISLPK